MESCVFLVGGQRASRRAEGRRRLETCPVAARVRLPAPGFGVGLGTFLPRSEAWGAPALHPVRWGKHGQGAQGFIRTVHERGRQVLLITSSL